ncbi:MAG: leucine-rich repeat domain-containing protein, partial [Fibrobacter sp.]|nr:leucine-rich repeat domain-containing protein [Fibrobacter sp.]
MENLDLSLAYIVDGGGCYFKIDDETYYKTQNGTKANIYPDQAFMSTKLKRIKLPSSVNTIGRYSFIFCNDLNEIIWNDQVKKIDFSAFNYTALKTVIIPESVETVGPYAFCNMADLNKVKFSN